MSKLKEHLFCECDECIREYRWPLSNEMRPYYLKSEADKVIAEKDKLIAYAQALVLEDIKLIRHQKFKRCLAMAEICCQKKENCYNRALRKYSKDEADYLASKSDFWQDWEFRWLKIA